MEERIKYIDVAKGILMCCLVWGHMSIISRWYGMDDKILHGVNATIRLYGAFFMQTFFIITGLCSSFTTPFKVYLWKNVKTLVLPAIFITLIVKFIEMPFSGFNLGYRAILSSIKDWFLIGGPWFIWTLFYAKALFWGIVKLNTKAQLVIVVLLYILGFTLHQANVFPNYLWHRHTLLMMPYLWLGNFLKDKMEAIDKYLLPVGLFGAVSIFIQNIMRILFNYPIPTHDWWIGLEWWSIPIHMINVLTGTAFVFWISKRLQNVTIMSVLGGGQFADLSIRRICTENVFVFYAIFLASRDSIRICFFSCIPVFCIHHPV